MHVVYGDCNQGMRPHGHISLSYTCVAMIILRGPPMITISGNIVLHAQLQVPPTQSLLQIAHEHAPDMPLMPG